jgi:hypothetical protein
MRPKCRILRVNGLFDVRGFSSFLIHLIRIQRNVLADLSADAVAVRIAVQIILVLIAHITAAITRHSFQQFWDFLGNPIDLCNLTCE